MQISLNWLKDYIDLQGIALDDISKALTDIGLEVEVIEQKSPLSGPIVVGHIVATSPHPNAENLKLTKVATGDSEPLDIVCGAPNAREGLKVAVAKVGAILPGDFKIKKSKIRGEASFGMLCSGAELGISADDGGILELAEDVAIGTAISDLFSLQDTVIHLGLTPNRSDCNGYIGIARDLAAKLQRPTKLPGGKIATSSDFHSQDHVQVSLAKHDDCGRFVALAVNGVKVIPSPMWLQRRLEASGMRPINLIVDATNYAMLEFSQPIHAYDNRAITGNHIYVRRAAADEKLQTLDGNNLALVATDLVIADESGAIGLAGVMGGANSEVKDDTTGIIIEVAHFNGSLIRKTAKRVGLHTEASHRFERGTDINVLSQVAYRVAELITSGLEEAGAPLPQVAATAVDQFPQPPQPGRIALRLDRLRKISGLPTIRDKECRAILERLGFTFLDQKDSRMVFEVPSWRNDIIREADLIEEVCRIHGYDKLSYTLPMMEIKPLPEDPFIEFNERVKVSAAEAGFNEIISFPFMAPADLTKLQLPEQHPMTAAVRLANPLAEDQSLLITTTVVNLLKAAAKNRRLGNTGGSYFEVARGFFREPKVPESGPLAALSRQGRHIQGRARQDQRPTERTMLGLLMAQPFLEKTWSAAPRLCDFFDLKAAAQSVLAHLNIPDAAVSREHVEQIPWLHPRAAATIQVHGRTIGYLGEVHPLTCQAFDFPINERPLIAEFDLEEAMAAAQEPREKLTTTSAYPPVTRDLAFVVNDTVTHQDFCATLESFKKRNLQSFRLFDLYQGDGIAPDKQSMAYTFVFQSNKRTLTDKEVEKEVDLLKEWLNHNLGANLR